MSHAPHYLTKPGLGKVLAQLFPEEHFIRDQRVPGTQANRRPGYRCERLKLIAEFDDGRHYGRSAVILHDQENDRMFEAMGYRVVRIPFFVQMSPAVAEHLFSMTFQPSEPINPHGFIADSALLPADFCALGIERFLDDLKRFSFVAPEILTSLRAKIHQLGEVRRVLPPALLNLVTTSGPESEGVTKFRLDFRQAPPVEAPLIAPLNAWRTVLHRLGLIAQDARRYGGVGFGNVSLRTTGATLHRTASDFVVSGTQTGGLERLSEWDYCRVLDYDLSANALSAEGPIPPSSESLTHAAVYRAAPRVQCVIHVHSPEIWRHARALGIPLIDAQIAYGTPEMAQAVGSLVGSGADHGILAMGGHEDGILAYDASPDAAALNLMQCLVRALQASAASLPGPYG